MNSVKLPENIGDLAEEIHHVKGLTASLRVDFGDWEQGVADRCRIIADLFLAERYLASYLQILQEAEVARQRAAVKPQGNNIFYLPLTSRGMSVQF